MAHRIEVGLKPHLFDARGERTKHQIKNASSYAIETIFCLDVYSVDEENIDEFWLKEAFCDPVIQDIAIDSQLPRKFDWYIEVGFRPGVTDNIGHTSTNALKLISGKTLDVYSSKAFLIKGSLDRALAEKLAYDFLGNSLIQSFRIFSPQDVKSGISPYIPKVLASSNNESQVENINLEISDADLASLSRARTLALTLDEMKVIQAYFRDPSALKLRKKQFLDSLITDVELEVLAQTWSEHCKHKIFSANITYEESGKKEEISSLFKTYIQGSTNEIRKKRKDKDICVSVFTDNAGVIRFNKDYHLVFKVETHNSPSALDPYGGALTGIVGVNRDPFGTGIGAKLIFNTDVFCFASPFYDKDLPKRILHPRRIFEGVREGVEHGGNKSGIPTVNGCLVFDERYLGKPLVYCGTAGIMPVKINGKPSHEKKIDPGDLIVMAGGKIGKDGIHGATFSSEELHEESPTSAVQIGDPITQKRLTDFLLRARDLGLYAAITDNGAGGLSSSIGEMSLLSGGCTLELEKPPLKYHGLKPWEILLSEAQERMSLAVPKEKIEDFLSLSEQMGVESTVIGTFTDTGFFHCTYEGNTVAYLSLDFLHNGLPKMQLHAKWEEKDLKDAATIEPEDQNKKLLEMLSRLNICSKDYVVRQYDHEVQGGSVIKPLSGKDHDGPSDAGVVRPLLESMEAVVVSNGIAPRYSDIDAYHMAACSLDEALRNYLCAGGDPENWACLDNFCWCDPVESEKTPDGKYKLAQLVRANKALYDYTIAFDCPCVSGKDSMKNDYIIGDTKISIPPTILFSVIGKMKNAENAVTLDIKHPGDLIYILGTTKKELGGSEYLASLGQIGANVPKVDAKSAYARYKKLHKAINMGLVSAAHDLSDGGLAIAATEMAFSGGIGIELDLSCVPAKGKLSATELLYSESASRILIAVEPKNKAHIEKIFGNDAACIGKSTTATRVVIKGLKQNTLIDADLSGLKTAWKATLDF
jgi:phosphoribosylformylglycinamidine synthase